jgi:phosphopantetheinyl transferase
MKSKLELLISDETSFSMRKNDLISRKSLREFSLSHTDNISILAATNSERKIGIDIEEKRELDSKAFPYFMQQSEFKFLLEVCPITIWSIKEAIFKSHNKNKGLRLVDLFIETLNQDNGQAKCSITGEKFNFCFKSDDKFVLSLAINSHQNSVTKEVQYA